VLSVHSNDYNDNPKLPLTVATVIILSRGEPTAAESVHGSRQGAQLRVTATINVNLWQQSM
jgi:hypothetical protein